MEALQKTNDIISRWVISLSVLIRMDSLLLFIVFDKKQSYAVLNLHYIVIRGAGDITNHSVW